MNDTATFDKLAAMVVLMTKGKKVGRTVLNKLLWFADVAHLLMHGRTISGAVYGKWQYGPVPQAIEVVRRVLIDRKLLEEEITENDQYRTFAYEAKSGNIDFGILSKEFSPSEIQVIKAVRTALRDETASYLSEKSHQFEPWRSARPGADLDISKALEDNALRDWLKGQKIIH